MIWLFNQSFAVLNNPNLAEPFMWTFIIVSSVKKAES